MYSSEDKEPKGPYTYSCSFIRGADSEDGNERNSYVVGPV